MYTFTILVIARPDARAGSIITWKKKTLLEQPNFDPVPVTSYHYSRVVTRRCTPCSDPPTTLVGGGGGNYVGKPFNWLTSGGSVDGEEDAAIDGVVEPAVVGRPHPGGLAQQVEAWKLVLDVALHLTLGVDKFKLKNKPCAFTHDPCLPWCTCPATPGWAGVPWRPRAAPTAGSPPASTRPWAWA